MSEIVERGDVYFFYRPAVEEDEPSGMVDLQRFFMVLRRRSGKGGDGERHRLVVIGRKRMPEPDDAGDRLWGFVDAAAETPDPVAEALGEAEYETRTRGRRHLPAARPAGEGGYVLLRRNRATRLLYALDLPEEPDEVQAELNIADEASFVITVKNPEASTPDGMGLEPEQQAEFPEALQERFEGRRFIACDPPDFLDHEGCEVVLIPTGRDVGEEMDEDERGSLPHPHEDSEGEPIFDEIRLSADDRRSKPLFEGSWE